MPNLRVIANIQLHEIVSDVSHLTQRKNAANRASLLVWTVHLETAREKAIA